jgi:hypothetical protein
MVGDKCVCANSKACARRGTSWLLHTLLGWWAL